MTCIDLWGLQGVPAGKPYDEDGNLQNPTEARSTTHLPVVKEDLDFLDLPFKPDSKSRGQKIGDQIGNGASLIDLTGRMLENEGMKKTGSTMKKTGRVGGALFALTTVSIDVLTTDFESTEETGNFVENTVQTAAETAAGSFGAFVHIILENGNDEDGLTNLDNDKMSDAYSINKDDRDAYSLIMQYSSTGGN